MGNGALAIGPKLPRPSSTLPKATSLSKRADAAGHADAVHRVANALVERETLSGQEIDDIIRTALCGANVERLG